jgi:hypothetical protein
MKKLSAILIALYLLAGCSSGGGTSGGAGGVGTFTSESGLLLAASLTPNGSFSVDVIQSVCEIDPETGETTTEPGTMSILGTFTVTIQDITDLTNGLFPRGITLDKYTISYQQVGGRSNIALGTITNAQTFSLLSGNATGSTTVVLASLSTTLDQFARVYPGAGIYTYIVTITYSGRDLNNESITAVASTTIEMGDFDRCGS